MIYIWFTGYLILNNFIGRYIYYLPLLYSIIYYLKSQKLNYIDNKIIYLKNTKDNSKCNLELKSELKLKTYKCIKLCLNKININTDIFSSKYIDNKIIYFKNKYPQNYTIKQYDFKDRLLIYSLKIDNIFVKIINEILLYMLFYIKLATKYFITQQFGSMTGNITNKKLNNIKHNKNDNNKLSIDDRKKNILEKMKKI